MLPSAPQTKQTQGRNRICQSQPLFMDFTKSSEHLSDGEVRFQLLLDGTIGILYSMFSALSSLVVRNQQCLRPHREVAKAMISSCASYVQHLLSGKG
jgi:hypothetical protein